MVTAQESVNGLWALDAKMLCKLGPARLRPHRSTMVALAKSCEREGSFVDLERAIPALYRIGSDGKVKEAILDVVVQTPSCYTSHAIDVTICCPHGVIWN